MQGSDFRRLELIRGFLDENGHFPTHRDMLSLFGLKSKNATFRWGERMIREGILKKTGSRLAFANDDLKDSISEALELISDNGLWLSTNACVILTNYIGSKKNPSESVIQK